MQPRERIYLDNAATSWPKPEAVYAAVDRYQRESGAPAGRGAYAEAIEVERLIVQTRSSIARLIRASEPRRIVFTDNCTSALNLAIHGLLRRGDHVVTTVIEHNSVLRPLRQLEDSGDIAVSRVDCDSLGIVDPTDLKRAMQPETRLVVVSHASNVTGAIQPITEIGHIAREHGAIFLVDAAQTAGHVPIDIGQFQVDLLAAPGHKGLLGPLGTGFLFIGEGMEDELAAQRQGGTGTSSESDRQPRTLPDKYEAGNLNVAGLVGLAAGLQFIESRGVESLHEHQQKLTEPLIRGLWEIEGVRLFGPADRCQQAGVISLKIDGYDPQELAAMLDSAHRIQARAGLHCAPLAHQALGTFDSGGTLRLSVGPFNSARHVEVAVEAIAEAIAARTL